MNWGKKILFIYLAFVAGIVFLVIKAMNQNQDLVTNEYYEQELKYQQRIDESNRTDSITNPVDVHYKKDSLNVVFSDFFSGNDIKGDVLIYCPDDEKKDVKQEFVLAKGVVSFAVPYHSVGFRHIKIYWSADGKSYYKEQDLFIND